MSSCKDEDWYWAEMHGYERYRCPTCNKVFHTDGAVVCPYCGAGEEKEEE